MNPHSTMSNGVVHALHERPLGYTSNEKDGNG